MHKPNIKAAYNAVKKSTIKHSPEILTGIGIAGMVTTTVMAIRATPKALKLIGSAELKKANETNIPYEGHNLSKTEIIKVTWKCSSSYNRRFIYCLSDWSKFSKCQKKRRIGYGIFYS